MRVGVLSAAIGLCALVSMSGAQVLNEDAKLLADDRAQGDELGRSVSLSGGIAAAGAYTDDDNGSNSGSAYLFDADPMSPSYTQQLIKLLPDDGAPGDLFGGSISISNGLVAVGAFNNASNAPGSGSAYLFDADPGSGAFGQQLAKLVPTDGVAQAQFGFSIALSDGVAVVGARGDTENGNGAGAAYLFDADPASPSFGQQLVKLLPDMGQSGDVFGVSVDVQDGVAAVGATFASVDGVLAGAVYLFDALPGSPTFGQLLGTLSADDGSGGDSFGSAVSLSDGLIAIGAFADADNGTASGSAYLFDADPSSPNFGQQLAKLLPSDGAEFDQFAFNLALSGGVAVVGARLDDDLGLTSGSAYVFDADLSSPTFGQQQAKLLASDGAGNDALGISVAIESGLIVVGASGDADGTGRSGSAYLFDLNPCSAADLAFPPGSLDFSDIAAFLNAFDAMAPEADLAPPSGQWDFSDVAAFLTAFGLGCP